MENPRNGGVLEGGSSSRPPDPPFISYADITRDTTKISSSSIPSIPLKSQGFHLGEPAIFFSEEENSTLSISHKLTLVARCAYGRPPLATIKKFMEKSVGVRLAFTVGILDTRHLLFRFSSEDDFLMVWLKEAIYINGYLFRFFKWTPSFIAGIEPSLVPIWVNFPNLPLHLFNESALTSIGNIIGKVLKMDGPTKTWTRPSAARVCIEVDLLKKNPDRFWLGIGNKGRWQDIVYEKSTLFCTRCKKIGHEFETCKSGKNIRNKQKVVLQREVEELDARSKNKVWVEKQNHGESSNVIITGNTGKETEQSKGKDDQVSDFNEIINNAPLNRKGQEDLVVSNTGSMETDEIRESDSRNKEVDDHIRETAIFESSDSDIMQDLISGSNASPKQITDQDCGLPLSATAGQASSYPNSSINPYLMTATGKTDLSNGVGSQHFASLRDLKISNCPQLVILSNEDTELPANLEHLQIIDCKNLKMLPQRLHNLMFLKKLKICGCSALGSFPEMGLPTMLTHLEITNCKNLKSLPEGMTHNNMFLEYLIIQYCDSLTSFPRGGLPTSLEYLYINGCSSLVSLPEQMQNNTSLENLTIKNCHSLMSFPRGSWLSTTTLKSLEISKCPLLMSFPEGGLPTTLKVIKITEWCSTIESLHDLTSLQYLQIEECPSLVSFSEEGLPNTMETLKIYTCKNLKALPNQMHNLTSLVDLELVRCSSLVSFPEEGLPSNIKTLRIESCKNLKALPHRMHNLTSLQDLTIDNCPSVSFPEGGLPANLIKLDTGICDYLVQQLSEWGMQRLTSLARFSIGASDIKSLPKGLHSLTHLEEFSIHNCHKLASFPKEGLPTTLRELYIYNCPMLKQRFSATIFLTKLRLLAAFINSGSTTKDGDAFKYLELEELLDDSRVETSSGQTNETVSDETVSGTVSEAEFSTPTIEVSGIVSESGEPKSYDDALQVSVRVRDKADHSVKSIDDLLTHFKEEVAVFH
ncbi:hypothetical protein HHK36_032420 [Tetracentron sinense]|uniref:DUF4283 domain-containing protein n=1 Tax=Tetracentron sinense TaxID=13715 RepID=A0A835D0F9_TETSI|nr:hypothetical protein HHK36_032420 [Tetracentron sinense]